MLVKYHYRGRVERPNKKMGFVWHDGYSENSEEGLPCYPWRTKEEVRKEARAANHVAVFVKEY